MKRVIVIPARYGSTRLPGKPLVEIAGKPLIRWVWERAKTSTRADEVLIATDDVRVRDAASSFGASVVMTSSDCVSGTDRVFEVVKERDADIIVNLQGDEPLIRGEIIDRLISAFDTESLGMATLCTRTEDKIELESPHTVKVVLDKLGFALYFSRSPIPYFQKSPYRDAYKHIGIYAFSRPFLETFVGLPRGSLEETESLEQLRALEAGYRIKVLVLDYNGISIDTPEDVARARLMLGDTTHHGN